MDHSLTILEQCLHVNAISGKTPPNESCFDWKLGENQLRLIESELIETRKACNQNDLSEFVDGICDVLMTTFGQAARNNFPIEEAFYLMSSSLLTRFDRNMDDAILTMEKYRLLGITTKVDKRIVNDVEYYVVTVDGDQGPEYPDNKFLKSVNYQKPDYSALVSLMTRDGELSYYAPVQTPPRVIALSDLSELNSIEELESLLGDCNLVRSIKQNFEVTKDTVKTAVATMLADVVKPVCSIEVDSNDMPKIGRGLTHPIQHLDPLPMYSEFVQGSSYRDEASLNPGARYHQNNRWWAFTPENLRRLNDLIDIETIQSKISLREPSLSQQDFDAIANILRTVVPAVISSVLEMPDGYFRLVGQQLRFVGSLPIESNQKTWSFILNEVVDDCEKENEVSEVEEGVDEVSFALNVAQQRLLVRNSKPNSGRVRILRQLLPSIVNWVCLGVAPGDRMKAKIAKETSSDAPLAAVVTLTIDSE